MLTYPDDHAMRDSAAGPAPLEADSPSMAPAPDQNGATNLRAVKLDSVAPAAT